MEIYYFSFGQIHVHSVGGITLDKDILLEVWAKDYATARQEVIDAIGTKWHMQYDKDSVTFGYFPRGTIRVPGIGEFIEKSPATKTTDQVVAAVRAGIEELDDSDVSEIIHWWAEDDDVRIDELANLHNELSAT